MFLIVFALICCIIYVLLFLWGRNKCLHFGRHTLTSSRVTSATHIDLIYYTLTWRCYHFFRPWNRVSFSLKMFAFVHLPRTFSVLSTYLLKTAHRYFFDPPCIIHSGFCVSEPTEIGWFLTQIFKRKVVVVFLRHNVYWLKRQHGKLIHCVVNTDQECHRTIEYTAAKTCCNAN